MLAPQKESIFGCSCRLWLLSWRRARIFARSCSLLSKYLPISWKQRKEQSHAQCHVTHRIRIFDKISEHVKVAKSVDIAVPELAVTMCRRKCSRSTTTASSSISFIAFVLVSDKIKLAPLSGARNHPCILVIFLAVVIWFRSEV